jgi:type IV pilus assembly protein PilF
VKAALISILLLLAGCVTVTENGSLPPRAEADLVEAARINTALGVDYARKGRFDVALDKLNRAIEQNPAHAPAHAALAFVHTQQGEYTKAEKSYTRALQLAPDDPATRNNFGVFLCSQKRYADAETVLLQAARNPRYSERETALTNAGVCARRIPDLDKAEGYFREALKLRPEFPEALAQLVGITLERRDYLRARAFVQRYEKVGPVTPETLWIAASAETALGDAAAAQTYAERLHKQFPESKESQSLSRSPSS